MVRRARTALTAGRGACPVSKFPHRGRRSRRWAPWACPAVGRKPGSFELSPSSSIGSSPSEAQKRLGVRVHEPQLAHAVRLVQVALAPVATRGGGGSANHITSGASTSSPRTRSRGSVVSPAPSGERAQIETAQRMSPQIRWWSTVRWWTMTTPPGSSVRRGSFCSRYSATLGAVADRKPCVGAAGRTPLRQRQWAYATCGGGRRPCPP